MISFSSKNLTGKSKPETELIEHLYRSRVEEFPPPHMSANTLHVYTTYLPLGT
jgi:hypothetical protein